MPTLSFEGETNDELVQKVKRWLDSSTADHPLSPAEAIQAGAELTKDALRVIASAAPEAVAQNDVVKALTEMGYKATDATRDALMQGLDALSSVTGGSVVKQGRKTGQQVVWEMNKEIAKQVLKGIRGSSSSS